MINDCSVKLYFKDKFIQMCVCDFCLFSYFTGFFGDFNFLCFSYIVLKIYIVY